MISNSMEDNLQNAIERTSVSTSLHCIRNEEEDAHDSKRLGADGNGHMGREVCYSDRVCYEPNKDAKARAFISSIYDLHKIGRSEPTASYFRLSSRLDKQNLRRPKLDQLRYRTMIDVLDETVWIVTSKNPKNFSDYPELCLFFTDFKPHDTHSFRYGIHRKLKMLTTRRVDSRPNWRVDKWNSKRSHSRNTDEIMQQVTELRDYYRASIDSTPSHTTEANADQEYTPLWWPSSRSAGLETGKWNWTSGSVGDKAKSDLVWEIFELGDVLQHQRRGMNHPSRSDTSDRFETMLKTLEKITSAIESLNRSQPATQPGPSRIRKDVEIIELPSDKADTPQPSNASGSSSKRNHDLLTKVMNSEDIQSDIDPIGEDSSSMVTPKRLRIDLAALGDSMEEEAFETLLAEGYFRDDVQSVAYR